MIGKQCIGLGRRHRINESRTARPWTGRSVMDRQHQLAILVRKQVAARDETIRTTLRREVPQLAAFSLSPGHSRGVQFVSQLACSSKQCVGRYRRGLRDQLGRGRVKVFSGDNIVDTAEPPANGIGGIQRYLPCRNGRSNRRLPGRSALVPGLDFGPARLQHHRAQLHELCRVDLRRAGQRLNQRHGTDESILLSQARVAELPTRPPRNRRGSRDRVGLNSSLKPRD